VEHTLRLTDLDACPWSAPPRSRRDVIPAPPG